MLPAIKNVVEIIKETAEEEILPKFRKLKADEVQQKTGEEDIVTSVDIEAEKLLTKRLVSLLPGSVVIAEEEAYKNSNVFDRFSGNAPVWVIDPIDGTYNFAQGHDNFAIMVALVIRGETVAGWIYNPVHDIMATSEKGEGAWLNGEKMKIPIPHSFEEMTGAMCGADKEIFEPISEHIKTLHMRGCCGNEILELIQGKINFLGFFGKIMPWDFAAGVLIHNEAGGYVANINGEEYMPQEAYHGGLIFAPDKENWEKITDRMQLETVTSFSSSKDNSTD